MLASGVTRKWSAEPNGREPSYPASTSAGTRTVERYVSATNPHVGCGSRPSRRLIVSGSHSDAVMFHRTETLRVGSATRSFAHRPTHCHLADTLSSTASRTPSYEVAVPHHHDGWARRHHVAGPQRPSGP